MPFSKRSLEGWIMFDHRESPGIGPDLARRVGHGTLPMRGLFESAVLTCCGCQSQIILNPNRSRERAYCPEHDHYQCDRCHTTRVLTGKCPDFKRIMDEHLAAVVKNGGA